MHGIDTSHPVSYILQETNEYLGHYWCMLVPEEIFHLQIVTNAKCNWCHKEFRNSKFQMGLAVYKNVLLFCLCYIRTMVRFHMLELIFLLAEHFVQWFHLPNIWAFYGHLSIESVPDPSMGFHSGQMLIQSATHSYIWLSVIFLPAVIS